MREIITEKTGNHVQVISRLLGYYSSFFLFLFPAMLLKVER